MIGAQFHEGSGLGDQLFRYITLRTVAEEKGLDWGMAHRENFKGGSFMDLKMYSDYPPEQDFPYFPWNEKDVRDANGVDIRSYDPEINFIKDCAFIDGSFEDDKYWGHNLANINKWLAVEPLKIAEDLCVVGFRGGEYAQNPDLFLTPDYWEKAMKLIGEKKFEVHTDDPPLARQHFPKLLIINNDIISHSKHTNMGYNWRSARYARYAIIPNSAFFIIPRLLKHFEDPTAVTIAPRYWARRNTKTWARPACFYKPFMYV